MQIRDIALDAIEPSPSNPRRRRNPVADAELMASVSTYGILTPLLVRPAAEPGKYQIAAGHRRYDAATMLKLSTVPVQIREIDDKEYMEVLHVENLQREDVHPLDEAIGYKELLKNGGYDIATLSAKIGKSEGYLHQRLKLNDLIKEAQKLFADEKIGFGHAVILARLDKKQQKDILLNHLFSYRNEPVSVRELSDYVRRFLYLDLGSVPWPLDDAELLATAGACALCPKRTGSNASLFADMDKNTCTDRACFEKKMQAYLQKQIDSRPGLLKFSDYSVNHKKNSSILTGASCRRIWGREDKCESAEEAIMVDGSDRGKTVFVCRNRECVTHRLHAQEGSERSTADRKKHRVEKAFRQRLFATIRKKVNALPGDTVTRLVAHAMWRRMLKLAELYGIDVKAIRNGL